MEGETGERKKGGEEKEEEEEERPRYKTWRMRRPLGMFEARWWDDLGQGKRGNLNQEVTGTL